jgi:hypothetical protein
LVLSFTIKNPVSEYVYTYGIMVQLYLIERFSAKLQGVENANEYRMDGFHKEYVLYI